MAAIRCLPEPERFGYDPRMHSENSTRNTVIGVSACLFAVIVSGIVSIVLSHIIYYVALKRIGAAIPSLILLLIPFTTLAISRVVYGEQLLPAQ